ncbi:MAG: DUF169 domain-containing protein [Candidatus Hydrogenedentales bacterium]
MESNLISALELEYSPVVLEWTNEKPEGAIEFGKQKWGCVMFHFAAALKGRTAVMSRETYGCQGGGVGMGFGNTYTAFPGGCECFYRFLADGNESDPEGKKIGEMIENAGPREMGRDFLKGERYLKDAETTRRFVASLPIQEIPTDYVLFRRMEREDLDNEAVKSVTLVVNPDQLSALVVMANHEHPERENVGIPYGAGCQVIGIFMYREAEKEHPRALVGLTDLSARKNLERLIGKDKMTFSMTPKMFQWMEENVDTSFFKRHTWAALQETTRP